MPIVVNGNTYKPKRHFFNTIFPDCDKPTNNEIDFYMYHNVPEYNEKKKTYYREKYRKQRNNKVRKYIKYNVHSNASKSAISMTADEFQKHFFTNDLSPPNK